MMDYYDLRSFDLADKDGFRAYMDFAVDSTDCDVLTQDEKRALFLMAWLEALQPAGKC